MTLQSRTEALKERPPQPRLRQLEQKHGAATSHFRPDPGSTAFSDGNLPPSPPSSRAGSLASALRLPELDPLWLRGAQQHPGSHPPDAGSTPRHENRMPPREQGQCGGEALFCLFWNCS